MPSSSKQSATPDPTSKRSSKSTSTPASKPAPKARQRKASSSRVPSTGHASAAGQESAAVRESREEGSYEVQSLTYRVEDARAEATKETGPEGQAVKIPRAAEAKTTKKSSGDKAAPSEQGMQRVKLPKVNLNLPLHLRPAEAMRLAQEAFAQTGYWISFYRAILGPDGVVQKLFQEEGEMDYFETTREFEEIHKSLTALRSSDVEKAELIEAQRMITIRLPKSLQKALIREAARHRVSINKLCISKLLLPVEPQFVPEERGKVRGRKPGR